MHPRQMVSEDGSHQKWKVVHPTIGLVAVYDAWVTCPSTGWRTWYDAWVTCPQGGIHTTHFLYSLLHHMTVTREGISRATPRLGRTRRATPSLVSSVPRCGNATNLVIMRDRGDV